MRPTAKPPANPPRPIDIGRPRSGPTQTEEARAASGMRQLKLRVGQTVIDQLAELAQAQSTTNSGLVATLISAAHSKLKPRKPVK